MRTTKGTKDTIENRRQTRSATPEDAGTRRKTATGSELRVDWGPGYRVYFGRDGRTVVVLLCGGDKRKQDTDIKRATELWQEYENRKRRDLRARKS